MANRLVGAAAGLIGGQIAGRILSLALRTRLGERLLERIDGHALTPLEHRVLVQRWSGTIGKALSGALVALSLLWGGRGRRGEVAPARRGGASGGAMGAGLMPERRINWVEVLQRAAEVLLAVGAIFKVVGEFLEEREKVAGERRQAAARQLM